MLNKLFVFSLMLVMFFFFVMMNSFSIYMQWLMMEFCTILLISMINIKFKNKIISIFYYMISSISSLLLILMISINFNQLFIMKMEMMNLILMISMFMKIGLFPFCFWMIYIYKISFSWNQIFLISTFMKFIPIYFFSLLIYLTSDMMYMLIFNNMFISIYTNLNFSMKKMFGCSSIFNSIFFIIINQMNKNLFMLFIILYTFIFFIMMFLLEYYKIKNMNFNNLSNKSCNLLIIMLFIYSCFPLFLTFLLKWEFIYLLNILYSNNINLLLLLSSIFMLWNYFNLLEPLILKFNYYKNFMNKEIFMFNYLILFFIFMYSIMFLMFNLM